MILIYWLWFCPLNMEHVKMMRLGKVVSNALPGPI